MKKNKKDLRLCPACREWKPPEDFERHSCEDGGVPSNDFLFCNKCVRENKKINQDEVNK